MLEFAEQEIVLTDGPYPGRFRGDRQPFARLLLNAISSGLWSTFNAVGPVQSGKTIVCFIIPLLYHLFELRETVVCGVPDADLASDKWAKVILPAIKATRYERELPLSGSGSQGGTRARAIHFRNGATLRFMTGGGTDATRSSFTTRVVLITETDKLDVVGNTSRESDKVTQLIARTKAFDDQARVYMECTASTEEGRTWQNHLAGTQSKIALPCPHCHGWVVPSDTPADRELLTGWKEAKDEHEARDHGAFLCSLCGKPWTEGERAEANRRAVLVHRGQAIERVKHETSEIAARQLDATGEQSVQRIQGTDYAIVGDPPRTRMLSFRWSAINNLLRTAGNMAAEEFIKAREADEENATRAVLQFLWALPHKPDLTEMTPLRSEDVQKRTTKLGRSIAPGETTFITAGIDIGKWRAHYVIVASTPGGSHILEYGCLDIATDLAGIQRATLTALREFRDRCAAGFPRATGGTIKPDAVWIDCNYDESRAAIVAFCRESAGLLKWEMFRPLIGRGEGPEWGTKYRQPNNKTGNTLRFAGEQYHVTFFRADAIDIVEANVDHWKSVVHDRLAMPAEAPGAMTLYHGLPAEHLTFSKHLTAEKRVQELIPERGVVTKWQRVRGNNHWFDAATYATAAGHFAAYFRNRPKAAPRAQIIGTTLTMPDGRPFFVGDR